MSPRLFDRLAATASILILIGLGMVSYYFARQAEQNQAAPAVEGRTDTDCFVEKMSLMRADRNGNPSVRMEADRMLHYPLDGHVEFAEPRIISLDDAQPLTTITARRGSAPDNGDFADLHEDVQVRRQPATRTDGSEAAPPMQMFTDNAHADMNSRVITTDDPVTMRAGENRLAGVGMEIREDSQELKLRSRVKGYFPPATHD